MLLELFICKRPTDAIFNESLNIHKYVSLALPEHVMEIVDPSLLLAEEEQNINQEEWKNVYSRFWKSGLVVTCSASTPRDRAPIDTILSIFKQFRSPSLQGDDNINNCLFFPISIQSTY